MNNNLPNLYDAFGLDRNDDSEALGISLSARDLRLEQMGIAENDPRRTQTVQAFAVLADPAKRATYDAQIDSGIPLTWAQIQHLGNFGSLPTHQPFSAPSSPHQAQPQQQWSTNPDQGYVYGNPTMDHTAQGYNPINDQVNSSMFAGQPFASAPATKGFSGSTPQRPAAGTRLGMAIMDMFFAGIIGAIIAGIFSFGSDFLFGIITFLFTIVYIIGGETVLGSTPAKLLMGYETRDVTTGAKLSAGASLKRNWWKLIGVTGIGSIISFIMAAVYGSSINPGNDMRGAHDRLANAEIVKKNS
ncbi:hypothetical protein CDES_03470 [Corynebacterium deserti GIMN1.010]|uniref:RDD domain-containing protein n=1 Tax=Corynebacterium deserti GIMN1.010 TaxID=931089 RepID=A0A0M4CKK2_9CORY|nr:RDD family protein [Corynebacterium deserti]ALC05147.1 hypothetical protein CDES_03470 [Corynebacterium deserti GIMN1.010]